jgi:type II secretory pathway pseudopilin PulG
MNTIRGFTFIEVIVFIIVIGIAAAGVLLSFNTVLSQSHQPTQILKATQLANARLNLILLYGLSGNYSDPCVTTPVPAACTPLITYATAEGFTVSSNYSTVGSVTTATVSVSGKGNAQLSMRFYP